MKYRKWSAEEVVFIKEHSGRLSDTEIAEMLGAIKNEHITRDMIRRQRRNIGKVKKRGRKNPNPVV